MKTVSFQGTALTDSERRRLNASRRPDPLLNTHLSELVSNSLAEDSARKATGQPPARQWQLITHQRGTPYVGDIFIF